MAAVIVIGVDPGGANTGIVVCDNDDLFWSMTETRVKNEPVHEYAYRVLHTLDAAMAQARDTGDGSGILGVEAVKAPNPHVRVTNPQGIIDTGVVFGAVVAHVHGPVVVVPPGRHGSHPLSAYPTPLRPTRGQGRGCDRRRHVRSAYDIAQVALQEHRVKGLVDMR